MRSTSRRRNGDGRYRDDNCANIWRHSSIGDILTYFNNIHKRINCTFTAFGLFAQHLS